MAKSIEIAIMLLYLSSIAFGQIGAGRRRIDRDGILSNNRHEKHSHYQVFSGERV